jgi:hypothetical protein
LADALMVEGCDGQEILNHFRSEELHVRGRCVGTGVVFVASAPICTHFLLLLQLFEK